MDIPTHIRKALQTDMKAVLGLIKGLARYEKAPDEVIVTESMLIEDGFGSKPIFTCYVAEMENKVVGFALYYEKYSTWKGRCLHLEDFYLLPEYRGKKIGAALFKQVMQDAKKAKVQRLEWQVLDWNEPAIDFYKAFGAELDGEWLNGKFRFEALQQVDN